MRAPTRIVSIPAGSTADETLGHAIDCREYEYGVFYVRGTGTLDSGVITFEEADIAPGEQMYTGVWSSIGTMNATDVTLGAQKAQHLSVGAYAYVRARISTVIAGSGGSVEVVFYGSGGRD